MENQNESKNQGIGANNPDNNLDSQSLNKSDKENQNTSNTWPIDETLQEYLEKDKADSKMKPGSLHKE